MIHRLDFSERVRWCSLSSFNGSETVIMGRKNRRQSTEPDERPISAQHRRVEDFDGEDWVVQSITGSTSTKPYRCPGCDHEIRPATPHVVAWPLEDGRGGTGLQQRRHWHSACWQRRHHRDRRTGR